MMSFLDWIRDVLSSRLPSLLYKMDQLKKAESNSKVEDALAKSKEELNSESK